jgi:hypothetical protein
VLFDVCLRKKWFLAGIVIPDCRNSGLHSAATTVNDYLIMFTSGSDLRHRRFAKVGKSISSIDSFENDSIRKKWRHAYDRQRLRI